MSVRAKEGGKNCKERSGGRQHWIKRGWSGGRAEIWDTVRKNSSFELSTKEGWREQWRERGRERNLIYWKYYKLHLCITPLNYQPIKAECLLLSHYMDIRSRSKSMSRERGRGKKEEESEWERGMERGEERRGDEASTAVVNVLLCRRKGAAERVV